MNISDSTLQETNPDLKPTKIAPPKLNTYIFSALLVIFIGISIYLYKENLDQKTIILNSKEDLLKKQDEIDELNSLVVSQGNSIVENNKTVGDEKVSMPDPMDDTRFKPIKIVDLDIPPITGNTGEIQGKLQFPSEFTPAQQVCAENISTKVAYCRKTILNQDRYTLEVPPGDYHVFANVLNRDTGEVEYGWRANYDEFVVCGLDGDCPSRDIIVVKVEAGQTVSNIDPINWY